MIDTDSWRGGVTVRYCFGQEEAKKLMMSTSTGGRDEAFFRDPREWVQTLTDRDAETLKIEAPLYNSGDTLLTFDLTGSKEALRKLEGSCGF